MSKALIIVDVQNDFLRGGSLAVPHGNDVIPAITDIAIDGRYDYCVLTGDFHPVNTKHFDVWPPHCIQGTDGTHLYFESILHWDAIVVKGDSMEDDGYSAFEGHVSGSNVPLEDWLSELGVDEVHIVGLAFDYCVGETALDAVERGYATLIAMRGTKSIDVDSALAMQRRLINAGVMLDVD